MALSCVGAVDYEQPAAGRAQCESAVASAFVSIPWP